MVRVLRSIQHTPDAIFTGQCHKSTRIGQKVQHQYIWIHKAVAYCTDFGGWRRDAKVSTDQRGQQSRQNHQVRLQNSAQIFRFGKQVSRNPAQKNQESVIIVSCVSLVFYTKKRLHDFVFESNEIALYLSRNNAAHYPYSLLALAQFVHCHSFTDLIKPYLQRIQK